MPAPPSSFAPGWYPDPTGRHTHRWYDGAAWTDHVGNGGRASIDPLADGTAPIAARSGGRRDAVRLLGITAGVLAVVVVALFAWTLWMLTSGRGPAGDAFQRYSDCLEARPPAECEEELRALLIERLAPASPAD